jgi:hypothetical protein
MPAIVWIDDMITGNHKNLNSIPYGYCNGFAEYFSARKMMRRAGMVISFIKEH